MSEVDELRLPFDLMEYYQAPKVDRLTLLVRHADDGAWVILDRDYLPQDRQILLGRPQEPLTPDLISGIRDNSKGTFFPLRMAREGSVLQLDYATDNPDDTLGTRRSIGFMSLGGQVPGNRVTPFMRFAVLADTVAPDYAAVHHLGSLTQVRVAGASGRGTYLRAGEETFLRVAGGENIDTGLSKAKSRFSTILTQARLNGIPMLGRDNA